MTDTHEAERLADWLHATVNMYPQMSEDEPGGYATEFDQKVDEAAVLLRRIPELEAERDRLSAALATHPAQAQQAGEVEILRDSLAAKADRIDRLGETVERQQNAMRSVMGRLAEMLDEDQFAHIENLATRAGCTPPAPAQPAAPPTKVANPYSGVGQVSEGWCRANPGLAAMAINRLSAWLNELQQDQAAGHPPTPPAQQGEPT